ncbi:MAG: TetR family transcriptional regulator [Saprospiraceae bacterium]
MSTKEKILIASKKLFLSEGFRAPTLNLLAQKVGISRGNLTYYFKDKEALLEALAEEMWAKYEANIGRAMQFPSWGSTNEVTKVYLELQEEYSFIFQDVKVISHPMIIEQIQRMKEDLLKRQMSTIAFSIQVGNMQPERISGSYRNMCEMIWMVNFYWLSSQIYRKSNDKTRWDKLVWSLILPYFTEKGLESFKNHFGQEYYNALGDNFQTNQFQTVGF